MILIVDFDHTIALGTSKGDTSDIFKGASPNTNLINKLQKMHSEGAQIIIFTARGMLSCNNDAEKARLKYENILKEWLKRYKVPYDNLIFGKPYGDYYIDDKALTPEAFLKL